MEFKDVIFYRSNETTKITIINGPKTTLNKIADKK